MINKKKLQELIETNDNCLQVNKKLIQILGVECAVLYTYLLSEYFEKFNKYMVQENCFLCNVEDIQKKLKFSPFKQRNLLNELIKYKLIDIKYGQSRTRYIYINEDISVLQNLLYDVKYTDITNKLISYIVKNIENFYEEEDFNIEDSLQLYNHLSKINFNKSIKESKEYKNFETCWLSSLEDQDINIINKNLYAKELIKR